MIEHTPLSDMPNSVLDDEPCSSLSMGLAPFDDVTPLLMIGHAPLDDWPCRVWYKGTSEHVGV